MTHYQDIANDISNSLKTNNFWDKINKSKGNYINNEISIKVDNQTITNKDTKHLQG